MKPIEETSKMNQPHQKKIPSDMNDNALSLKPINDLLSEQFFIPAYQRGFRWKRRQVRELLEDVLEFCDKEHASKDEFYCLQPIVVKDKDGQWELVDGQQRLTAIFLILKYFNERLAEKYQKSIFSIEYETREDSKKYLESLDKKKKEKNIDFFHIYESFQQIEEWFQEYQNRINDIESVFLNKVKVIWYEIKEDINPIKVFSRLNIGKIPLTNSELVKALFLRSKNFNKNEITLQQIKIAQEWYEIEKSLQSDSFWYFISNKDNFSNRIEFILELIADEYITEASYKNDPYYTFLVFNKKFAKIKWTKIKKYFMTVEEWYDDRYLYHLIGYLVNEGKTIAEIKKDADNCESKREFRNVLKAKIFQSLFDDDQQSLDELGGDKLRDSLKDHLANWDYDGNKSKIRSSLLLFNIATLIANTSSNMRFQFDSFKKESWDIEHVRSIKSGMPESTRDQESWLENVLVYFTGEKKKHQQQESIEKISKEEQDFCNRCINLISGKTFDSKAFEELYDELLVHFNSNNETAINSDSSETDNSIGNLTLLDATTNRSYKNAVFPIKRKLILELDKKGTFVPLCTKNLFLKYYSKKIDNMMVWSKEDSEDILKSIIDTFFDFFLMEQGGGK